jgi:hypothetical protein
MKKIIRLTESQVKKIMEVRINEVSTSEIAKSLESIDCTGEDVKKLIIKKLESFNFEDIRLNFIGRTDDDSLMYSIYTEGPMFIIYTRSENNEDSLCLNIYRVDSYNKVSPY